MKKAYLEGFFFTYQIPTELSWVCIESFEFPTGLDLPGTILSFLSEARKVLQEFQLRWPHPFNHPSTDITDSSHSKGFVLLVYSLSLSLSPFSPTQLTSLLVRPDEQVAHKYVLGSFFPCLKTFHLCSCFLSLTDKQSILGSSLLFIFVNTTQRTVV